MIYSLAMSIETIITEIDAEIARLTQVRSLLAGSRTINASGAARKPAKVSNKRRVLSAEARKRIADAQRKRWAAQKAKSKKGQSAA
jgi:hypothetical protein